jgi:hypothetical protein
MFLGFKDLGWAEDWGRSPCFAFNPPAICDVHGTF